MVLMLSVNAAIAQSCMKTCEMKCEKKNSYVINGDLIQAILYHDNGEVAQTGFYTKNNELHGEWISYDVEGNKTAIGRYDKGEKVGTWMFYQGNTMKEVTYTDSRVSDVRSWTDTKPKVVSNR